MISAKFQASVYNISSFNFSDEIILIIMIIIIMIIKIIINYYKALFSNQS